MKNKWKEMVLLLTATINPNNIIFTERSDPKIRLHDYKSSFAQWILINPFPQKIVFCENSRWDLSELKELAQNNNPFNKQIEFLSFDHNNYKRSLGKGYGEAYIIKYFLENSTLINSDDLIVKVTGRYFIKNIEKLINGVKMYPKVDIFCDLRKELTFSDSRIFFASSKFLKTYFIPISNMIDETSGILFEHVLARATLLCIANGGRWMTLPRYPKIIGISGSGNYKFKSSILFNFKWGAINRLKNIILSY